MVTEASKENGKFDADVYFEMLRENPFISSPDLSKIKLRSNFKERFISTTGPKIRNNDDNDEEYSRYSSDKTRKIHRMSMKTIPLKQTYSQPILDEPQSQRVQDYNNLTMNTRSNELSQPKFEKNMSMKQIPFDTRIEEQKFENVKLNHSNSISQIQHHSVLNKAVSLSQVRSDVDMQDKFKHLGPPEFLDMPMKLNDLCRVIKNHNEALFLQIPKTSKESNVAGGIGSDDNGSQAAGRYERRKSPKFLETFFTGCKDDEFINVSWVENKVQFEYNMNAFNQELYIPDIISALNLHNLKSDKDIKTIQNKFNLSFSEQKRNKDIDMKSSSFKTEDQGQIQNLDNLTLDEFNLSNLYTDPTLSKCRKFIARERIFQKNMMELGLTNQASNTSIDQFLMENDDAFVD